LIGRNGAGKSTLVSLLTGLQRPDEGEVEISGVPASAGAPDLACVYQHSRLVPALTVAENVMMGHYPHRHKSVIDWDAVRSLARGPLEDWGMGHLADALVEDLDPVQAKVVEICRALSQRPGVLLLDEPTAGLDKQDAERLFGFVDQLRTRNVTLVYVSHHLDEIYQLCDSATVLRDARHVLTSNLSELPKEALIQAMVGDGAPSGVSVSKADLVQDEVAKASVETSVGLSIDGLIVDGTLEPFDLLVRQGECVGIAGLEGSGKTEVGAVLAGIRRPDGGQVFVRQRKVRLGDVPAALAAGISYVPPDRRTQGIVPLMSVSENTTMTATRGLSRTVIPCILAILLRRDLERVYRKLAGEWQIVASSPQQAIGELSGGNQQKCVMARGFATEPAVLVMQNPTAGIDVASKASIMATLDQMLSRGAAGIVISEDFEDFSLCSRVLVLVRGQVRSVLEGAWTEGDLVSAMQGVEQ
jgi:simple sugar transport system ATP-binding protein